MRAQNLRLKAARAYVHTIHIYTGYIYIYLHTRALSGQHSDPCTLSALEPFFCYFSAARPCFVARLAPSDSPQSRGSCPRADPPSPQPSRSASELARSRLRGLPHAPYVFARTPVPIYCYLLLVLGLLLYLLPSNRLIVLYSNHHTYHILLVITILLLVVGYIYWPQYIHTYLQCYTPLLVVRAV